MIDFIGKGIVVDSVKTILNEFINRVFDRTSVNQEQRNNIAQAISAIKLASIETSNFIKTKGYISNSNLSGLWLNAFNACISAGITGELPEFLYHKADFWGSPTEWFDNPSTLELIPKLKELNNVCDSLMVKLQR